MQKNDIKVSLADFSDREIAVRVRVDAAESIFKMTAPADTWSSPPPTMDFAAIALAQFASAQGRNLRVEGELTASQVQNLERFIEIWSVWSPSTFRPIDIHSDRSALHAACPPARAVMAFSGGVDASFALIAHNTRMLGASSPAVGLGVLIGGLDIADNDLESQATAFASIKRTLEAFGVASALVTTNWKTAFCVDWEKGHNAILASVLNTFSNDYGAAVIASDVAYDEELAVGAYGNHTSTNHLLGSARFPVMVTGGTHSRMARVREICRHPSALENVRVCYQRHAQGRNCGRCKKCIFTRLAIEACGGATAGLFDKDFDVGAIEAISIGIHGKLYLEDILSNLDRASPHYRALQNLHRREIAKFRTPEHRAAMAELDAARARIRELKQSTFRKITAPVRSPVRRLRTFIGH